MAFTKGHPFYAGGEKGWIKKGSKLSDETRKKMSETRKRLGIKPPSAKGRKMSVEVREAMSLARRGKKGTPLTDEAKAHLSRYWTGRRKPEDHWSWKGGISPENHRIRQSAQYIKWRKTIFERDDYTCLLCSQKGGRLNADHIKPFADYPELRFDLDNGRTLCEPCHRKTDTYGWNKYNKQKVGIVE